MDSNSLQNMPHFWIMDKTCNSSHIAPNINLYTISQRQAPKSHSQTFAAQSCLLGERSSLLAQAASTGNHELTWLSSSVRWFGLSDGNLAVVHGTARHPAFLGVLPISRHEIHPGCGCSRKCTLRMDAGLVEGWRLEGLGITMSP